MFLEENCIQPPNHYDHSIHIFLPKTVRKFAFKLGTFSQKKTAANNYQKELKPHTTKKQSY
jgi:hypothetical protein